jgi:hypothetical protein
MATTHAKALQALNAPILNLRQLLSDAFLVGNDLNAANHRCDENRTR